LYDIFVNLAALEITVSHTRLQRAVFQMMTKTHKERDRARYSSPATPTTQRDVCDLDVMREIKAQNEELIKKKKI